MEVNYKNHKISSQGRKIPKTDRWAAKVMISWRERDSDRFQGFDGPVSGFASQGEAES